MTLMDLFYLPDSWFALLLNWLIISAASVLATSLIAGLICKKTQRFSRASLMSVINILAAAMIAAVSIRRITNAPHICEFCVGHADDYLRFIVPPMCIVSVVCLIIAIRQRKRKTANG